jgi:hypothetical protein
LPQISDTERFARLGRPKRVWAVGAVHGDIRRLTTLHDHIAPRFEPGDRLVYLGNILGRGAAISETIDELLLFRRELLAMPGMLVDDIVYLRGAQEEMWQKLLQVQFAPNPGEVLQWMMQQGVDATLRTYGGRPEDGFIAARDGAMALTRWTNRLRDAMRAAPGHNSLYAAIKRAGFTDDGVLLVSAGLDISRPLAAQGDSFWWSSTAFTKIDQPYEGFRRIIRGYDKTNGGVKIAAVTACLDGGCGRGGSLVAGLFNPAGDVLDIIEV